MPKVKISEFSSTPANNTDIDSINIAEGCAPSGINDAIRELMAQLKDFQVGSAGDPVTVGGVLTVQAGSASTPALTTAGDTNTGMFFPAADTIAFAEGGVEAMRLDASGNMGLGVTPSAWASGSKAIEIGTKGSAIWNLNQSNVSFTCNAYYDTAYKYGGTGLASAYQQAVGVHYWYTAPSGTAGNAITFTQAMTLDASGRLGVGTTTPAQKLHIDSGSAAYIAKFDSTAANGGYISLSSSGTEKGYVGLGSNLVSGASINDLAFSSAGATVFTTGGTGTERARIDSSGNLLVGTTSVPSGGQKMNIAGGITPTSDNAYIFGNSGLRWQALYAANGSIQTSDEREKTDIIDSPLGLDFITSLRPVAYKFKVGKNEVLEDGSVVPVAGTRQHFGLLAQDVKQKVGNVDFGGWILTDTTDAQSPQGLRYDEFISPLIKAIQELKAEFDAYKASHP